MKKLTLFFAATALAFPVIGQSDVGMYYVSGRPGEHGMWFSVKDNNGQWGRGDKVLLDGVFDGDAVDPDVILLDNGTYRLYYYKGYFVTPPPTNPEPNKIYLAESDDGINFEVRGIVFEYENITDPSIVELNDGDYLMACTYMEGANIHTVVAISADGGLNFSYLTTVYNTGIPEIYVLGDGSVRLFHNGPGGIISKRSFDNGVNWQSEPGLRFAATEFVADPSVIKAGNNLWWMFLKGFNQNGNPTPAGHKIMLAESTDEALTFSLINQMVLDSASVPEGTLLAQNVSIAENQQNGLKGKAFAVYPNPATAKVYIELDQSQPASVTIKLYNHQGRLVETMENILDQIVVLSTQQYAPGMYFLEIYRDEAFLGAQKLLVTDLTKSP